MSATATPAYVTTVRPDRTIVLPEAMVVGATVTVVLLPSTSELDSAAREKRFEATLSAISNASNKDTKENRVYFTRGFCVCKSFC